jgi:hypothetical protein
MCESFASRTALLLFIVFVLAHHFMLSFALTSARKSARLAIFARPNRFGIAIAPKSVRLYGDLKDSDFDEQGPRASDREIIFERIKSMERGKLLKSDAKMYGMCALLAREHLKDGNFGEAAKLAVVT